MPTAIFWKPDGLTLDSIRTKRFLDSTDGDSVDIRMPIRMLSIDAPEKGVTKTRDGLSGDDMRTLMDPLADWLESGGSPVDPRLVAHLLPRLRRPDMAEIHWQQGRDAGDAHRAIIDTRLARPGGGTRDLFVRVADERFERYGRLLAYIAPSYSREERETLPWRETVTFNFDFMASGWGAPLIIYPSIPNERDLPRVQAEARAAVEEGRGQWADPLALTGYEYRMVEGLTLLLKKVRAGEALTDRDRTGWISRYCADMSTALLYPPQLYFMVAPWNRLFAWHDTIAEAAARLNLRPAQEMALV
jgi:endonuclease YncB( thermonuclease family)